LQCRQRIAGRFRGFAAAQPRVNEIAGHVGETGIALVIFEHDRNSMRTHAFQKARIRAACVPDFQRMPQLQSVDLVGQEFEEASQIVG